MPRIFDNIELPLLPALQETLQVSDRADFCVGYFNLRGWKALDSYIERWPGGDEQCCRVLVGMQKAPIEEVKAAQGFFSRDPGMDNQTVIRLKKRLAQEFRDQLTIGAPTEADEAGLRRLARQIRARKVVVRLFLGHALHAKLYLMFRQDPVNPIVGFLGSSNLTLSGLSLQGELNVDVLDGDAAKKLARWFEDRWHDRWCIDISDALANVIEESWAREEPIPPYHIYVKMAYHLSQEARAGLSEFRIPKVFGNRLFEYQTAAVKIAARHLHKRGGVLVGDVVGLGKTLMATALARIFEDDFGMETLILCPKNLVTMWEDYRRRYGLRGTVLSISRAIRELPDLPRYRLVLIDESHNLRNPEGRTYRAIRDYIEKNDSHCMLLTATPYNKSYLDLSAQLRLFVPPDKDLGVAPERLFRDMADPGLLQVPPRTLAAFEKSPHPEDWRELMRLYMVRRTRTFIQENYAQTDLETGQKYLTFEDGSRSYFPGRRPRTARFGIDPQYAKLYATEVVDTVNTLRLARYGLGNYALPTPQEPPTQAEAKVLQDLSRAGKRLMGFCRTNLFKRLESSGPAFLLSVERHALRNFVFLHAIESGKPIPIGPQDAEMLDSRWYDEDADSTGVTANVLEDPEDAEEPAATDDAGRLRTEEGFRRRAAEVYHAYETEFRGRFKWLRPALFSQDLRKDLLNDALALLKVLQEGGAWDAGRDAKLDALARLLNTEHPREKVILFTQFADTVRYLERELQARGVERVAGVTGKSSDPTRMAWRFSPESNDKRREVSPADELRVLIATDVLSEGQNLQDCSIIVNYDLPWAIIRLIQRAGRVDRIGQKAHEIPCYSFLPADGVERIIRLRRRVRSRLRENAEVVGADEAFFEDDRDDQVIVDLYNEKANLDGDADTEVDLASYAYQIWKNAVTADPGIEDAVCGLPSVVYSTRTYTPSPGSPEGVLVYLHTGHGTDALAWMDREGRSVTESQYAILRAAECRPETPAIPRLREHHELVTEAVEHVAREERNIGGQLGRPSGARYRTYERLQRYAAQVRGTLFDTPDLHRAIEEIYRYPLCQAATDRLNSHLRSEITDEMLAQLVILLRDENRLCIITEEHQAREPRIICSMGLSRPGGGV